MLGKDNIEMIMLRQKTCDDIVAMILLRWYCCDDKIAMIPLRWSYLSPSGYLGNPPASRLPATKVTTAAYIVRLTNWRFNLLFCVCQFLQIWTCKFYRLRHGFRLNLGKLLEKIFLGSLFTVFETSNIFQAVREVKKWLKPKMEPSFNFSLSKSLPLYAALSIYRDSHNICNNVKCLRARGSQTFYDCEP